jgi:putative membrane protein
MKTSSSQIIAVAIGTMLLGGGCAQQSQLSMGRSGEFQSASASMISTRDSSFARTACLSSAAEIDLSRLAASHTRNKEIRAFAKRLEQDHATAEKELARLFAAKGIPAESELDPESKRAFEDLAPLKGGEFDRAFKRQVIQDHQKAIAAFESQAENGNDPQLRGFAKRHLAELREHLSVAEQLPISLDTTGPAPEVNANVVLQNPATRQIQPLR